MRKKATVEQRYFKCPFWLIEVMPIHQAVVYSMLATQSETAETLGLNKIDDHHWYKTQLDDYCKRTGLSKATVGRILKTLRALGLISTKTNKYRELFVRVECSKLEQFHAEYTANPETFRLPQDEASLTVEPRLKCSKRAYGNAQNDDLQNVKMSTTNTGVMLKMSICDAQNEHLLHTNTKMKTRKKTYMSLRKKLQRRLPPKVIESGTIDDNNSPAQSSLELLELQAVLTAKPPHVEKHALQGQDSILDTAGIIDTSRPPNVARRPRKASNSTTEGPSLGSQIWDAYQRAFQARYGFVPVRNKMSNTLCKQFGERLGVEGLQVIEFYLRHSDRFFIRESHSLKIAVAKAESLHTQWRAGRPITDFDAQQKERNESMIQMLERRRDEREQRR